MSLDRAEAIRKAEWHHDRAMNAASNGDSARRRDDEVAEISYYLEAYSGELVAAKLIAPYLDLEPSRSVLLRSAACLAIQCGCNTDALALIDAGLAGNPPDEIAEESRELRESLKSTSITKAVAEIRAAGGSDWDRIGDVEEYLGRKDETDGPA